MLKPLLFLSFLLCAAPAAADVTGRYRNGDQTITIEVNDAGLTRLGQDGGDSYTIFNGDEGFVVSNEDGGIVVMRWSDMVAVLDVEVARLLGEAPEPVAEPQESPNTWQSMGPATVEGRAGVEYSFPGETMAAGDTIVLSEDARLAPLGRAWARAFALMPSFGSLLGRTEAPATQQLIVLLADRGPLQLGRIRLIDAAFETIDSGRFALPGEPLSRDEVAAQFRHRMQANLADNPQ